MSGWQKFDVVVRLHIRIVISNKKKNKHTKKNCYFLYQPNKFTGPDIDKLKSTKAMFSFFLFYPMYFFALSSLTAGNI